MKGIWVGRPDESDAHVCGAHSTWNRYWTNCATNGYVRIQLGLVGKLKSRVRDAALSEAELLRVVLASFCTNMVGWRDGHRAVR